MTEFKTKAEDIKNLKIGLGSCFATDKITVEGSKVGFMYKQKPDNTTDSGWRFFAGDESDGYANDPQNISIYDVNTIANYDQSIIPFLDAPINSVFERDPQTNGWKQVFDFDVSSLD